MTDISLKIDLNELRKVYYDGESMSPKWFFGPTTRQQSTLFVIACIGFPFFLKNISAYSIPVLGCGILFFSLCIYNLIKVASPIIQRKKSVEMFIASITHVKELSFHYDEEKFIHVQDGVETTSTWKNLKEVNLSPTFIAFISPINLILIAGMMSEEEFNSLIVMITKKVEAA